MRFTRRPLLALTAALMLALGCKKNDAGQTAPAVDPGSTPKTESPAIVPADPDELVDLSDHVIRATIQLPKGTVIETRFAPPITAPSRPGSAPILVDPLTGVTGTFHQTLTNGKRFHLILGPGPTSLADRKAGVAKRGGSLVRDDADLFIAEAGSSFEFEALVRIGGVTIWARNGPNTHSRADIDRMIQSATSLKAIPNADALAAAEKSAWERLAAAGCPVGVCETGRKLVVSGDRITDAELQSVKDIPGITAIELANSPKVTARGIEALGDCRRLLDLRLVGPSITDTHANTLAKLKTPRRVALEGTSISDVGIQFASNYRDLRELILSGRGSILNGSGLSAFKLAKNLESVHIADLPISDPGLEHLVKVSSLKRLHLTNSRVTDGGLRLLDAHPSIVEVAVTNGPVRGGTMSTLAELPKLTSLSLRGVAITDGSLSYLKGSKLTELRVDNTPITDRGMAALSEIPDLAILDLSGTKVTDTGLQHLGRLDRLAELRLARTDLTGVGLTHFKARPSLKILDLTDTLVTDEAMASLSACPNLKTLHLAHTPITDAGLVMLADHKTLSEITLTGSAVTSAGVAKFKAARPTTTIEYLALTAVAEPKPAAPPVAVDKLPPADPVMIVQRYRGQISHEDNDRTKPVIAVKLAGTPITDADLAHLRGWKLLSTVDLTDCKNVTDAGLAYLALLPELVDLNLAGSGVRGDGLGHLKTVANLRALDLRKCGVTVKHLTPLAVLKDLTRLAIDPVADDATLAFLAGFPRLKDLDLRRFPFTNRRLAVLGKMTGLERLEIRSNEISDRGLSSLKSLNSLKELHLDSDSVSDAGLAAFSGAVGLKSLDLAGRRITDRGFQHFRECKEIERVTVERTQLTDAGVAWFKEFGKLLELELRYSDVTDKGLTYLADLHDLELLDVTGCAVTDNGLKSFTESKELRKLVLDRTRITGLGFKSIAKLPRLARVRMTGCPVSELGLDGLSNLEALEHLILDDTPITDDALGYLRVNPNLRSLSLVKAGKLTDKAVDILKACPALSEVNLSGSGVSAAAISELKKKEGLTVVAD